MPTAVSTSRCAKFNVTIFSRDDLPQYRLGGVRSALGLSRHAVSKLVELGFVHPQRSESGAYRFSFQDLVLLRSAYELRAAGLPTKRLLASLRDLRAALPPEVPVEGLRIVAAGDELTVWLDGHQWEPRTGQLVMDFEVSEAGKVSYIPRPTATSDTDAAADVCLLFAAAQELEESDPAGAERAYQEVLRLFPEHVNAYLNLGYLLCGAGRCQEALDVYTVALRRCVEDPLLLYNRAVALEGLGRQRDALDSYEAALALQPDLADAHQNAALLYAEIGEKQLAIRHFSAFRRLGRR